MEDSLDRDKSGAGADPALDHEKSGSGADPAVERDRSGAGADLAQRLMAGRVGRPHGLDGSFRVALARPALLSAGASVAVAGSRRTIVRRAGTDRQPIVRLDGCSSRAQAQDLHGEPLWVRRSEAPALGADEWWAEELEGCRVHDGTREVGVVRRLLSLPSCDVLEVARPDGSDLLVPMVRDALREVDVAGRRIEVDLGFVAPDA
ncbi:MAG TPA: ribosome maturation factor RimM [Solirubrobacteraceae bacterium]|jgi:16S rRNA processing protein RimM|nr:ribosome maturation factor RimM [Solirubrobacteraceae bacterium]